ncbi:MAG TPA: FAD-dependent oxidoreductase [Pirellulales bacterium]|jgi:D-amino-acid dehydrogenase|nr:FAD-dependent oxidoreductase [Pirellulales bacterium]
MSENLSLPAREQIVIVGGGVIGAACAYYLARAGCRVTLLERGQFGRGCSHGNCGYVSPSHVFPIAQPGVVGRSLKSMWNKDSPFYIKPRLNWALWSWLLHFWRRCNPRDMHAAGHAIHALLTTSRTLYDTLMQEESLACDWETHGLLFVLKSDAGFRHFAETDRALTEEYGLAAKPYAGTELNALEPALLPGLAGGWLYECDAHLRSDQLMAAWQRVLTARGVVIREGVELQGFEAGAHRATAAVTASGEKICADRFVIATGAWAPQLKHLFGCALPIQPGKGYSITMPRPKICPRFPMILEEHRVAVTPWESGFRLGSTMEFSGYDTKLNGTRLKLLKTGAAHYLYEPWAEPVREEWYGWRPMTYDSIPIIDFAPRFSNVLLAVGHSMLGLSMATGTGRLVTELLTGQTPHLDPTPYSLRRFR